MILRRVGRLQPGMDVILCGQLFTVDTYPQSVGDRVSVTFFRKDGRTLSVKLFPDDIVEIFDAELAP